MTTKKKIFTIVCLLVFCAIFAVSSFTPQQSAGELYEKALYLEEAQGDLEKAIDLYKKVLEQFPENREIAAKAQLHIGLCFEKLGHKEAVKAYELVVQNFSDQKEPASTARARLAALTEKKPPGLTFTKLLMPERLYIEPFALSPDGTKMLGVEFIKGQNICFYDFVKKKIEYITDFDWNNEGYRWAYNPVWSPDGNEIAYIAAGRIDEDSTYCSLRIASLDGKTRIIYESDEEWFQPNDWLPDGSAIVSLWRKSDKTWTLALISPEGGSFQELTSLQGEFSKYLPAASCSPDGRFIVFQNGPKYHDIFIIDIHSKSVETLTDHPASDSTPRWSSDGKHIVFVSHREGEGAIWGIAVSGGKPVGKPFRIRDWGNRPGLLSWNSKGLVGWSRIGMMDIYTVPFNPETGELAGKPKQIDYIPTGRNMIPLWSPDEKYLAFMAPRESPPGLYIIVMPLEGGETQDFLIPRVRSAILDLRWLPDSSGLSFSAQNLNKENTLYRLNMETEEWKTWPIPVDRWTRTEWRKDGKAFFYSNIGSKADGGGIVERVLETGVERYIYQPDERANFRGLRCSRDYKWLAFMENNKHIMIVNIESGESHEVATDIGYPAWSAGGESLLAVDAFGSLKKFPCTLRTVSVTGESIHSFDLTDNLPKGTRIRWPDWSPDGTTIAFCGNTVLDEMLLFQNVIPEDHLSPKKVEKEEDDS
ncbi:MAG: tetratricopeptide repeat protein [Candidatus Aminicenantes bacterium]|nr:tetratricopeptide repeat protein [Candidatus Aminicenantes bacterium]